MQNLKNDTDELTPVIFRSWADPSTLWSQDAMTCVEELGNRFSFYTIIGVGAFVCTAVPWTDLQPFKSVKGCSAVSFVHVLFPHIIYCRPDIRQLSEHAVLPHSFPCLNMLPEKHPSPPSPLLRWHVFVCLSLFYSTFKAQLKNPLLSDVTPVPCLHCEHNDWVLRVDEGPTWPCPLECTWVFWRQDQVLFIFSTQYLVHVIDSVNIDQNDGWMSNTCCHEINCTSQVSGSSLIRYETCEGNSTLSFLYVF